MILLVDCTCKRDEPYADGTLPEFYSDIKKARERYVALHATKRDPDGPLYWGVHFMGKHLVGDP